MSSETVTAAADPLVTGRRRADPRLPAYLIAGLGALVVAIATGRPELAALGAPFVALAAIGLLDRIPARPRGAVSLASERVLEGDVVEGKVRLDWDGEAEVDVMLARGLGVTAVDPAPVTGWSLPRGRGPVTLTFQLRARAWGIHDVGPFWVRVRRPGGMLMLEQKLASVPALRVLPRSLRLNRILKPSDPRAAAGMHLSRLRGQGTDFAELRPYQPGDRLRGVSWATSARLGKPWVAVHHPERTGTVLLLLDAFFGRDRTGAEAFARAARTAWAVASVHLQAQDRVGLLSRGRTTAWLTPSGGRRARWALLDELLAVGGAAEDPWRSEHRSGRVHVPADALIIGITGLEGPWFLSDLLHYRRSGHTTVALVIDRADLLPAAQTSLETAARRIWLARRDVEVHRLERAGVQTALVTNSENVGPAISALRRRMKASQHQARPGVALR